MRPTVCCRTDRAERKSTRRRSLSLASMAEGKNDRATFSRVLFLSLTLSRFSDLSFSRHCAVCTVRKACVYPHSDRRRNVACAVALLQNSAQLTRARYAPIWWHLAFWFAVRCGSEAFVVNVCRQLLRKGHFVWTRQTVNAKGSIAAPHSSSFGLLALQPQQHRVKCVM